MEPRTYAGAGGKIRRRPQLRAAATPYDRPPAAAAAHRLAAAADAAAGGGGGEGGGWLSRLVDPASRLIAGGAARLFSSVFRKRLAPPPPPPPSPPGGNTQSRKNIPEATHIGTSPPISDRGIDKGKSIASTSDDKALSEVEHLLMRKTFTRVEFDRITELLRSRTVELDLPAPPVHNEEKNEVNTSVKRDGIRSSISHGIASNHSVGADVPMGGVSSPAELAKQYMSSRPSRGSPSTISLRSRVFLEEKAEPSSAAYVTKRSGAPLVPKSIEYANENPEFSENGYVTPRLHGRSAIYRMSRSPFFKGSSSSSDMNVAPFSLSQTLTHSLHTGGRQVLKRRNADLDNEFGSIGPIRRIRQKSNMMSPFKDAHASPRGNLLPGCTSTHGLDVTEGSSSIQESPSLNKLLAGTAQFKRPLEAQKNVGDGKDSNDSFPPVPPQSNKMAEKIFEQLNIIAQSPKEKQFEPKSAAGDERRSMIIEHIPQDHGPRSTKDTTSSLKLRDLDGIGGFLDPDINDSLLDKKDKPKEDESSKLPSSAVKFTFQDRSVDAVKSDGSEVHDKPAIFRNSDSAATAPSRKPGFKMVVLEDSLELDDDQEASVPSKNAVSKVEFNAVDKVELKTTEQKFDPKLSKQKIEPKISEQKVESKILEHKVVNSPITSERTLTSLSKDIPSSSLISSDESEKKATSHVCADNRIGFTFPLVPSPSNHSEPPPRPTMPASPPAISTKENEQTAALTFTFGLKQSSTSTLATSTTAGVKADARLSESVAKPSLLDSSNSNKGDEREKAGGLPKPSETTISSAASTLVTPPPFAFSASTLPSLSNGFSHSSLPKFSFPAVSEVASVDKPTINSVPSTTMTTFAVSSSSQPISSAAPVFPTFNFSSSASTGSQMAPSDKSDGTNVEAKPASTVSFGIGSAIAEGKSVSPNSASSTSSTLSSIATFSSAAVTSSSAGTSASTSAPSTAFSTMAGLQSASATSFTFSNSGNNFFGFSAPAQSTSLSTSVDGSTSQASAAFGTSPGTVFGSTPPQSESGISQLSNSSTTQFSSPFPTPTFGVGTSSSGSGTLTFGVGTSSSGSGTSTFGVGTSSSGSGFGDLPFGSAAAFSKPFSSSSGSGFSFSSPSSAAAAASLKMASTNVFSSTSMPSSSSIFSNPFGSSSSPPSMFNFGQSASSGSGFTFAGQSAPVFSSQSASVFSFTSASSSLNSSTPQPAFGMANANVGFSTGSPGNDQMNVEDSMADDTNQPAPATVFGASPFGQLSSSPAASVFSAPAVQPGGIFQFGSHQGSVPQNPSSFPAAGSLEFQGGNFSLGSGGGGGGNKSGRRIVRVTRKGKKN